MGLLKEPKPWLGVIIRETVIRETPPLYIRVCDVNPSGPAATATQTDGVPNPVQKEDILMEWDGVTLISQQVFQDCVDKCYPGQVVTWNILRGALPLDLEFRVKARPQY